MVMISLFNCPCPRRWEENELGFKVLILARSVRGHSECHTYGGGARANHRFNPKQTKGKRQPERSIPRVRLKSNQKN